MKTVFYYLPVSLCLFPAFLYSGQVIKKSKPAAHLTIDAVREKYIGQIVVIQQAKSYWKGTNVRSGLSGEVVSVKLHQAASNTSESSRPNAFGDVILPSATPDDPYLDITVKLANGSEAATTFYEKEVCCERDRYKIKAVPLRLTSPRLIHAPIVKRNLGQLVGQKLYALRDSDLYVPTTTQEGLINRSGELIGIDDLKSEGLLRPLPIMKVDYDEPSDSIFFELRMPNGQLALAVSTYIEEGPGATFLENVEGSLFAAIPRSFSALDVKSLQQGVLMRGTRVDVVRELFGFEEAENDWGSGGEQLVYYGGRKLIYIDTNGNVRDWQNLDF